MLPHQKITYLPFQELNSPEEIAQEFSLGNIVNPIEQNNGGNVSFKIQTEKGTFQIKSYLQSKEDPNHYAPVIQREISFTRYLEVNGIKVPKHLSFQPFLYNNLLTTVTHYQEGTQLQSGKQTLDVIHSVANLVAKLHLLSLRHGSAGARLEQRASFKERVEENLPKIVELLSLSENDILPLLDKYSELRATRTQTDLPIPHSLTHGEITTVNLFELDGGLSLANFDGLKFTPLIFDFGQILLSMTYDGTLLDTALVNAFFESYQKQRALISQEKSLIPQELLYNYLHKLEWRMTAMLSNPGYIEIVKKLIKNSKIFIESIDSLVIN